MTPATLVVGGHHAVDEEIKFGMAGDEGVRPSRSHLANVGARPGDVLVPDEAARHGARHDRREAWRRRRRRARRGDRRACTTLNRAAAAALRAFGRHACTDFTGFGLMGPHYEMAHGSDVQIVLDAATAAAPSIARALASAGTVDRWVSPDTARLDSLADKVTIAESVFADLVEIAFDPQIAGRLLVCTAIVGGAPPLSTRSAKRRPRRRFAIGHVMDEGPIAG
jgi:selenide,water dikinase